MTNEELLQKILQGHPESIEELFIQNRGIILKLCNRYQSKRFSFDDLYQESYFALLKAIHGYQSESGYKFSTYFEVCVKRHFIRLYQQDKNKDDLYTLDSPIGDESDGTLLDLISDDTVTVEEDSLSLIIAEETVAQIKKKLLERSSTMWDIIRSYYLENQTLQEIADHLGVSFQRVQVIKNNAIRYLRSSDWWDRYQSKVIAESDSKSGLTYFRRSGTSGTEWAALKLID
ncbi:MAG: sigma-70 family RNA polymerase sigma factor [Clostridia bacterium]|nr:sigma-70 family RNA polymerase sigma factor [Clostridia bacterium]